MNGYFVSITNNLLEDKHYEKMGSSVWLYMWIIDKMTEISEGQGVVNYGNPVTLTLVRKNFSTMSERTYYRMVDTLRQAGYINTVKAQYGLYITVNKPKKQFNKPVSPAKKRGTQKSSPAKKCNPVLPNMADSPAKYGKSPIYKELPKAINNNITTHTEIEISDTAKIGIMYYEAIKILKLPVTNHTTIKSKIKAMEKEDELQNILNYLIFIKQNYTKWLYDYKPQINTALDIYTKRIQIRNAVQEQLVTKIKPRGRGFRVR